MKACFRLVFALLLAMAVMPQTQAQETGTVYLVTYIEVQPPAKSGAAALLKVFGDATRKDEGNLRTEVVESAARPGHFVVLTAWKDQKTLDGHMAAAHTKETRNKLHAMRTSPADDRIHNSLSVAAAEGGRAATPLYVITHVDVPPPRKDECVALLKRLVDASRKDDGSLRFDVVQQTNRPNHFTVIEVWKDENAFDAHTMAGHVREFRDQLTPMSGALYDERLYRVLK
jgi:quinol monooxygenase YgiN